MSRDEAIHVIELSQKIATDVSVKEAEYCFKNFEQARTIALSDMKKMAEIENLFEVEKNPKKLLLAIKEIVEK